MQFIIVENIQPSKTDVEEGESDTRRLGKHLVTFQSQQTGLN